MPRHARHSPNISARPSPHLEPRDSPGIGPIDRIDSLRTTSFTLNDSGGRELGGTARSGLSAGGYGSTGREIRHSLANRTPHGDLQRIRSRYFKHPEDDDKCAAHRAALAAKLRADSGVKFSLGYDVSGAAQPTDYAVLLEWLDPAFRRSSWTQVPRFSTVSRNSRNSRSSAPGEEETPQATDSEQIPDWISWDVFQAEFMRLSQHPEAHAERPAVPRRQLVLGGDEGAGGRFWAVIRRVIAKYDISPEDDYGRHPAVLSPPLAPSGRHGRLGLVCSAHVLSALALVIGASAMALIGSALGPLLPAPGGGVPFPVGRNASARALLLGCWTAQVLHLVFLTCMLLSFVALATSGDVAEVRAAAIRWICSKRGFVVAVVTGVCSGVGSSCWTLAFLQTSTSSAYVFNAFPPAFITLLRVVSGIGSNTIEHVGLGLCVVGVFFEFGGVSPTSVAPAPTMGAVLALVSSLTNTVCLISGKHATEIVPTVVYLAGITLFSAFAQLALTPLIVHEVSFSRDPEMGLFGWASPENEASGFHWVVLLFALGQWGIFTALRSMAVLTVSLTLAVVPVVATTFAVAVTHAEVSWPAPVSLLSGGLIVCGIICLVVGSGQFQEGDAPIDPDDMNTVTVDAAPDSPFAAQRDRIQGSRWEEERQQYRDP
eukprot:Hpha_TRINITY_DN2521_c0_g1::TRINITY_DN2521_c0_g1_i1::g.1533::m.1533